MSVRSIAQQALEQGQGIVRLKPAWVPRSFCIPGRRIKLHPDDYYALGGVRGGLDERWLSSTTPADNGPLTSPNEGLSFIVFQDGAKTQEVLLRDAISELKSEIVGDRIWRQHKRWPMYSKFFDNLGPLPHHVHHNDKYAKKTGQARQARGVLLPDPAQQSRRHVPVHVLRPPAWHDEGAGQAVADELHQGRQQADRPFGGVSPPAGHRLGRAAGRAARAGQPVHLRAAEGQRRLRHVPVAGGQRDHPRGVPAGRTRPRTNWATSTTLSRCWTGS